MSGFNAPPWPPKDTFQPPRYPNVWFLVALSLYAEYRDALKFLDALLRDRVGFEEMPPDSANLECCDAQRRIPGLQATVLTEPSRSHAHDLHIRYYFSHLPARGLHKVASPGGPKEFWRLPASVHYEPEAGHPGHPYIDECPVCGIVPPYDRPGDRCEVCHDPLGLELLLYGTIRQERVLYASGRPFCGLASLQYAVPHDLILSDGCWPERNTWRIGTVVFGEHLPADVGRTSR